MYKKLIIGRYCTSDNIELNNSMDGTIVCRERRTHASYGLSTD